METILMPRFFQRNHSNTVPTRAFETNLLSLTPPFLRNFDLESYENAEPPSIPPTQSYIQQVLQREQGYICRSEQVDTVVCIYFQCLAVNEEQAHRSKSPDRSGVHRKMQHMPNYSHGYVTMTCG